MRSFLGFLDGRLIKWFIVGIYSYFCLIILVEVVRRYVFGASSPWGEMTARYAFVYLTYVAAAEAIRHGRHIRIDIVPRSLAKSLRNWLELYFDLLTLLLAGLVIYYSLKLIEIQIAVGIVMTAADINMAFAQAALPLGWGLILIRILQNWYDRFRGGSTAPAEFFAD
jgi:TRAP-type C4-dicarboxylate transport system permease small subunit